ncbi:Phenylacetone monooxygenase [Bosea sp. 62]|uniref:flavin-containing monooxygenase n=1 Tax=unclassified Bosea (in: a-proteobacteria) TaxID=2653178 RepID=UPI001256AE6B|nr:MULTISPECIES: NAD(P)/FAD-dependent oxidoreductase [unclassified Bosea (in: a-proteobacteria)]CAD5257103.1 Phenylacetone monooxygenase [Bosea sp. 7B]CAD5273177.1 Phenylacetone monooxygenase [Bosea sp. 21B]CAD5284923.1 Phenylacetone monooxygenase [Bosea sp. 46]VVT60235.1 Phenylacetone monooxygenase [Bosea sp. EC-HK365B]VXB60318.1 Phenylacetone monooxygenase [Bosea sp. 62]
MTMEANSRPAGDSRFDVVIVGAGFSGLFMLHRLRGLGFSVRVCEAGSDVGGTWFWNRYPGARCDVESMQYSYSFDEALQQDWRWSERFATQPEILSYINHVADRFDLRRDISLDTRIASATYDEDAAEWALTTQAGERIVARFCIMATGCLSAARIPDFPGMVDYRGRVYHTGHWPHEGVDFSGLNVGIIGTGSSAIQAIPPIAAQARHLTVFQRTPNFSVPARNWRMTDAYEQSWKQDYAALRRRAREETRSGTIYEFSDKGALAVDAETRWREYERRWQQGGANFMHAYNDILVDKAANDTAAEFVRGKIRETVADPQTAEALLPHGHPLGAKRICVDTDYYETFNRDNVTLVDVRRAPIERLTQGGLRIGGRDYAFDAIVFATGFDAMTGALDAIAIHGRGGATLKEAWSAGPRTYLGLMSVGFPNLFTVTGPGSPSVLSNVIVSIEQHVDWIADCLAHLRRQAISTIEPEQAAQDNWVAHVNEVAHRTLYPQANSWYMGANVPGKTRVFMPYIGGVNVYRRICDEVAAEGYRGFRLAGAPALEIKPEPCAAL